MESRVDTYDDSIEAFLNDKDSGNKYPDAEICPLDSCNANINVLRRQDALSDYTSNDDNAVSENKAKFTIIKICGCKLRFNRPLMCLRMALFFWYGGLLPLIDLQLVFMKQKGLTLLQFSSAFSVTFLFQLLSTTVSGIVADKFGRVKPILLFHMLATVVVVTAMLVAPNVDKTNCNQTIRYFPCYDEYNETMLNLSFCNLTSSNKTTVDNGSFFDAKIYNIEYFKISSSTLNMENSKVLDCENYQETNLSICFKNISHLKVTKNCTVLCSSHFENDCSHKNDLLVILYVVLTFSFIVFCTTAYRFLDVIFMFVVTTHNSDYGRERLFPAASEIIVGIVVSFAMDASSSSSASYNYDVVYWISLCFIFLAILSVYSLNIDAKPPGRQLTKKALYLSKNTDVLFFLIVIFVLGSNLCFDIVFHALFLEKLKAPKLLFGLHIAAGTSYGFLLLLTHKWWLQKLGATKIFVLCLFCHAVSGALYSFLINPWLSLLLEISPAFTYYLLWPAVLVYSQQVAPEGLASSVIALPGVIHFGIARSTGVLGGGLLVNSYGQRVTYRIYASLCSVTAILYASFLYWRHSTSRNKSVTNAKEVRQDESIQL